MKKLYQLFVVMLIATMGTQGMAQNTIIQELNVLDSNDVYFRMGDQSLIYSNGSYHLFYVTHSDDNIDYIIKRTSGNGGISWDEPDTISTHIPSTVGVRFFANNPAATVDENGNIHVMYEYRGLPLYAPSYTDYPPSHMNYVYHDGNDWVTEVNVINDHEIQAGQGNSSTVCYLFSNQFTNYKGNQYYLGVDYAWWATMYNIVYSDNKSGDWLAGSPLYTNNVGAIDYRLLGASTLIAVDDSLYAIWYQSQDCYVEMMAYDGSQWSDLNVMYTDAYIPLSSVNNYTVGGSSFSNGAEAVVTMKRTPESDFNELLVLNKKVGTPWMTDTLMLDNNYALVRPMATSDTTLLLMVSASFLFDSYLYKYLPGQGIVSKSPLVTSQSEKQFSNLITPYNSNRGLITYMIYDEQKSMYYLKTGKLTGYLGVNESEIPYKPGVVLSQNFPNPANGNTTISYEVNNDNHIIINIYDIQGKHIRTLFDGHKNQGKYTATFNASELDEGIYFYSIVAGGDTQTRKMVVIK